MGYSSLAFEELVTGLHFFISALVHVIKTWEKWRRCLRYSRTALGLVVSATIAYWIFTLPLQWMGWWTFHWYYEARNTSYVALALLQLLLPELPADVFWEVLGSRDKGLHFRIRSMPSIYSKRARAKSWALVVVTIIVLVGIVVTFMPLLAPVLGHATYVAVVALASVLATAWWAIAIFVVSVAATVALAALSFGSYSFLEPFLRLWAFDPIFAIIGIILLALGATRFAHMQVVLRMSVELYYSTTLLIKQLLWPYAKRKEKDEWIQFARRHCWRFCGFGLPIFVLLRTLPIAAVALLEVLHGSAACLLADLLAMDKEDRQTEKPDTTSMDKENRQTQKPDTTSKSE
eukprot:CAMPEP_0172813794 /NCGR_PEP_ID=MMETSP1075-20121228/10873_1 /TAXON_ID=2916 /ORGANISM="Ceratium fusus, Strain PA161109" /LENGTH=346 /DNA_ID=CAMNT_0013653531 /DNA_START=94 /DNA_END=1134 /DNA_ORIENTATION=+